MNNYTHITTIFIGLFLLLSTFSMAQTINGAMSLVSQNFEDGQMNEWGYNPENTCYDISKYAWSRVDTLGKLNNNPITEGSNGSQFWGAWDLESAGCGGNGSVEDLEFDTQLIPCLLYTSPSPRDS